MPAVNQLAKWSGHLVNVLILGGGGHCLSLIGLLDDFPDFQLVGIVERDGHRSADAHGYPIVGHDHDLPALKHVADAAIVGVGAPGSQLIRRQLFEKARSAGFLLPTLISPAAVVSRRASLGAGTVVMPGAVVNAGSQIGDNCIVNSMALVEHGVRIGSHTHISTGARVNGESHVGEGSFIGSGAVVRESVRLGDHCIVGAGCLIGFNLEDGTLVRARWTRVT